IIGRRFLPWRDVAKELTRNKSVDWESQYDLDEQLFNIRIPSDSLLINKTLAESRLGSGLGWNLIGIIRNNQVRPAPGPAETLQAGDQLTIEGSIVDLKELKN
ncbi:MAG: TrkA C-terminal domain-containing protein, partial [Deltaproteobacteria bacterium]|nr:TrkA C-terminal domain-containing protein [Deltaproteobacteria bacterium]